MKVVKAFVLALAVSVCAHAGVMDNGLTAPPPPQPAPAIQGPTTDGEMNTPLTTDGEMPHGASDGIIQNDAAATFMQVVLNLLALS